MPYRKECCKLKTVRLGKTGLEVSRVGIGGIPIQRPPEDEAIEVIRRALDLGVNLIDTSIGYGDSEERIGKAIAGRREQVIIATKGRWKDKATALENIEQSLKRLNTDYIDLWQFHGVNTLEGYEGVLGPGGAMEGAQEARQAGKIRHIGMSSHSPDVTKEAVASGRFETIQFPFNFVARELAEELAPLARKHNVGFIAMKPFAGGVLQDVAVCIRYLLSVPGVAADPGFECIKEVEEVLSLWKESAPLSDNDKAKMERLREELGTRFCRRCGYCMPCPNGVNIMLLMQMETLVKRFPAQRLGETWIADAVGSVENCVECGQCEEKCPYDLQIIEQIRRGAEVRNKALPGVPAAD